MTEDEKMAVCAAFMIQIDQLKEAIIARLDDDFDRIMLNDVSGIFSVMWEREEFLKFILSL